MECQTLTVKQLAEYLGVHTDLVYSLVSKEEIPYFRLHSKILFRKGSIDNWITEQENTSK